MVTDVYGESGSGKSQLCFTLCANCIKDGGSAMFIDTAGTFRPERVVEVAGSPNVLERITYIRALNTFDQSGAAKKIADLGPRLVLVDTLTSLFSAEFSGPARHLAMMRHLHELALAAINADCAVVVTNMIRNVPVTVIDQSGRNIEAAVIPAQQREYLGGSVSIYSHIKLKLEILDAARSSFQATLVQPAGRSPAPFRITSRGISDSH